MPSCQFAAKCRELRVQYIDAGGIYFVMSAAG